MSDEDLTPEQLRGTGPSAYEVHYKALQTATRTRDIPFCVRMVPQRRIPRIAICPNWDEVARQSPEPSAPTLLDVVRLAGLVLRDALRRKLRAA